MGRTWRQDLYLHFVFRSVSKSKFKQYVSHHETRIPLQAETVRSWHCLYCMGTSWLLRPFLLVHGEFQEAVLLLYGANRWTKLFEQQQCLARTCAIDPTHQVPFFLHPRGDPPLHGVLLAISEYFGTRRLLRCWLSLTKKKDKTKRSMVSQLVDHVYKIQPKKG